MIVCSCTGSTDRDVERAFDAGAVNIDAIGDSCSAGSFCGGCHASLTALLHRRSCETCPNRSELGRECGRAPVPEA
jgi:bacterioferritin-associated ferredoxin